MHAAKARAESHPVRPACPPASEGWAGRCFVALLHSSRAGGCVDSQYRKVCGLEAPQKWVWTGEAQVDTTL